MLVKGRGVKVVSGVRICLTWLVNLSWEPGLSTLCTKETLKQHFISGGRYLVCQDQLRERELTRQCWFHAITRGSGKRPYEHSTTSTGSWRQHQPGCSWWLHVRTFHIYIINFRPGHNGHHIYNAIFKGMLLNKDFYYLSQISLKFNPYSAVGNK